MTYKKTWLSYLLWAVYTCATGVMVANYAILFWQKRISGYVDYQTALFVMAVFAGLAVCYFLIRKGARFFLESGRKGGRRSKKPLLGETAFWNTVIAVLIFSGGLIYRMLSYMQHSMDEVALTEYYQQATVRSGENIETMVHGASYLYTQCLSFVFSFLGNKAAAAVWLQIFIQMLTILLLFLILRELLGNIPTFVVMAVFSFSNIYNEHIYDMTPEDFFFLLYLIGFYIIGSYIKTYCREYFHVRSMILGAVLVGVSMGILIYLDALALTLLIFLAGLFTGIRDNAETASFSMRIPVSLFILVIASGGLTLMGIFALDACFSRLRVGQMAEAWYNLYQNHLSADYVFYQTDMSLIGCFVLVLLAALLILAFWNRRKTQNVSPWIVLMLILAPTPLTKAGVLSYQVYAIFIWSILAGIGLQQSFVWESISPRKSVLAAEGVPVTESFVESAVPEAAPMSVPVVESAAPEPDSASTSAVESAAQETKPVTVSKPRFIENPLPLPKKHERKEMGYQYDVTEDMMGYDVEIDENDDFDHP